MIREKMQEQGEKRIKNKINFPNATSHAPLNLAKILENITLMKFVFWKGEYLNSSKRICIF